MRFQNLSRRAFLRWTALVAGGATLAACQPKIVEVTKIVTQEKIVEKPVEKVVTSVVKQTVVVAGTPQVVEKVVTKNVPALKSTTVTWATDHLAGARGEMTAAIQKMWPDKYPDIKIKLEPIASDDYWQVVDTKMAAGTTSDIILFEGNLIAKYAQLGGFLPVDEFLADDNFKLNDYYIVPDVIEYMGKHYGMPYQLAVFGWWYNKTLLEKEGQPLPKAGWTFDDLLASAKACTKSTAKDGKTDQWGISGAFGANPSDWYTVICNGARPYNKEHTKTTLNDPKCVEALQWMYDLVLKHHVMPSATENKTITQALGGSLWNMGKVAFLHANSGGIGNWLTAIKDKFEWAPAPNPTWKATGLHKMNWNDQPHVLTRAATGHAREAWKFLAFMSGPEVSTLAAKYRGWTPVHVPTAKSDAYLSAPPKDMKLIIEDWIPNDFDCMFFDRWLEWWETTNAELDLAKIGERSVKESCEVATKKGDIVLAKGGFVKS